MVSGTVADSDAWLAYNKCRRFHVWTYGFRVPYLSVFSFWRGGTFAIRVGKSAALSPYLSDYVSRTLGKLSQSCSSSPFNDYDLLVAECLALVRITFRPSREGLYCGLTVHFTILLSRCCQLSDIQIFQPKKNSHLPLLAAQRLPRLAKSLSVPVHNYA